MLLSLPSPLSHEYLILLIFFLVEVCKLPRKTGKNKASVLGTTLRLALGKGTGVSLGSKMVSASRGLTWAGREDAALAQAAVTPSCCWGTENRFPPQAGPCLPAEMVYVVCASICPSLQSFEPIGHFRLNLEKRPPMLLCFAS